MRIILPNQYRTTQKPKPTTYASHKISYETFQDLKLQSGMLKLKKTSRVVTNSPLSKRNPQRQKKMKAMKMKILNRIPPPRAFKLVLPKLLILLMLFLHPLKLLLMALEMLHLAIEHSLALFLSWKAKWFVYH